MRYYGAKTKLLPLIEEVVKSTGVNGTSNFVDLFAGTTSVGQHFKKLGYTVYSNDMLEFSYALSKTYIELNKEPQFKKLNSKLKLKNGISSLLNYLNKSDTNTQGFIYENYSPNGERMYFTDENAQKIDTFRTLFEEWKNEKLINELEYYYLITSLLRGVNLISNVTGTYGAYLKTWDNRALKPLILEEVPIIKSSTKNKAFKKDANELIKSIKPDILYLDPPYNSRQYASNYFLLELIAEGWFGEKQPEIYGKTGMRNYEHQKSDYCSKTKALNALEDLVLNGSKAKYILLSYNNEGVISQPGIQKVLEKVGEVETMFENHKRYRSINQTVEDPQLTMEFVYKVKPKKTVNKTNNLSGKEWLQNSFSIWRELGKTDEERKLNHPAIFTIKLASKLIDTFCKPNGGKILDPFAGSGTTLLAGLMKKKEIIGFDLNPEFKELFIKRATQSYNFDEYNLEKKYIVNDSRFLTNHIEENSVDLCITSPPYWDVLNRRRTADYKDNVNYSDQNEDLGNIEDYNEFLQSLKEVTGEVFKSLKPKGYYILNVMDLRKKSNFYPLHMDASMLAKEIGFNLEDIIIWDRQNEYNNMRPLGYPYKFIVNKVHEYLLILRKPEK
ncbi:DNA adenine methylase [Allomuricauda sp. SCSIO 65647]|uniref:DNA adenine methylase n=1 Tax=Allomuricauda sp. SCSIO 65647 TaxID=2908843 RepID=UPI001F3938D0|nr:DNA adenine methylase [Muricauda sp. SCSIO 65647]UJH68916.1 DNA adenine methylase [Muricauda sp. SCSIO 65647]